MPDSDPTFGPPRCGRQDSGDDNAQAGFEAIPSNASRKPLKSRKPPNQLAANALIHPKVCKKTNHVADYGYRYMDPLMGRWLSRDPIGELGHLTGLHQLGADVNRHSSAITNVGKVRLRQRGGNDSGSNNLNQVASIKLMHVQHWDSGVPKHAEENLYRFASNDGVGNTDLLGLCDKNPTRVARKIIQEYNPISIAENREYGGLICKNKCGCKYATLAPIGNEGGVDPQQAPCKKGDKMVADWHTHGANLDKDGDGIGDDPYSEVLSPRDTDDNKKFGIDGYLGTPSGKFIQYDVGNDESIYR